MPPPTCADAPPARVCARDRTSQPEPAGEARRPSLADSHSDAHAQPLRGDIGLASAHDRRHLRPTRPPQPPGRASALARAPQLQFAPPTLGPRRRLRRKYLPPDYEPGDIYRHLDTYVAEARHAHLAQRRAVRGGRHTSRSHSRSRSHTSLSARSAAASSRASTCSSSSSSTASTASYSSSSSEGRYGLTLARIRAFFGSDSSASSDNSSPAHSDSDSAQASILSRSRRSVPRSATSGPSRASRSHRWPRASSRITRRPSRHGPGSGYSSGSDSDHECCMSTCTCPSSKAGCSRRCASFRRKSASSRHALRHCSQHNPHAHQHSIAPDPDPRAPPTVQNRSAGPDLQGPSRRARQAARLARQRAGGATKFTMFTPVALPLPLPDRPLRQAPGAARTNPAAETQHQGAHLNANVRAHAVTGSVFATGPASKVLRTSSFLAVKQQLYALRAYRRQEDAAAADLGLGGAAEPHGPEAGTVDPTAPTPPALPGPDQLRSDPDQSGEEGDLALPPPAIPLSSPPSAQADTQQCGSPTDGPDEPRPGDNLVDLALRIPETSTSQARDFAAGLSSRPGMHLLPPSPHVHRPAQPPSPLPTVPDAERAEEARVRALAPPIQVASRDQDWSPSLRGGRPLVQPPTPVASSSSIAGTMPVTSPAHPPGDISPYVTTDQDAQTKVVPAEGTGREDSAGAWWLDIQLPTYRTMVEISKLFPLHPLTVEDVLQQEEWERIQSFDKLGYYFVSVRKPVDPLPRCLRPDVLPTESPAGPSSPDSIAASDDRVKTIKTGETGGNTSSPGSFASRVLSSLDKGAEQVRISKTSRLAHWLPQRTGLFSKPSPAKEEVELSERATGPGEKGTDSNPGPAVDPVRDNDDGGLVTVANMYLVVFSHGVISFHYEDLSADTNRVLERLVNLSQPVDLTSDWIVHGLVDSIVDSFFPILTRVEEIIQWFEDATAGPIDPTASAETKWNAAELELQAVGEAHGRGNLPLFGQRALDYRMRLRYRLRRVHLPLPHWVALYLPSACVQQVLRAPLHSRRSTGRTATRRQTSQAASALLRGMTDVRRSLMSLVRLMAPKNEVLGSLQGRILEMRTASVARSEVSMYLGDVHDHILSLLSSFQTAEGLLSDLHAAYQTTVVLYNRQIRQNMERKVLVLVTITNMCMAGTLLASVFGLNVLIPAKSDRYPHHWPFGVIVIVVALLQATIWFLYQTWMVQAQRRLDQRRKVR